MKITKIYNKINSKINSKKVNMHIPLPVCNTAYIGTHFACVSPYEPWRKK